MNTSKSDLLAKLLALVAMLTGLLTVLSGGRTLFGGEAERLAAGAVVPFVLWFNFVTGFAYLTCGLGTVGAAALVGAAGRLHRRRDRLGVRGLRRPCVERWRVRVANRRRDGAAHGALGRDRGNSLPSAPASDLTTRLAQSGARR